MKKSLLPLIFAATLATSCCTTGPEKDPAEPTMQVVALQHTSAKEMSDTISKFLADAEASGVDHPTLHTSKDDDRALLIKGQSKQVQQIIMMIAQLDVEQPK